MILNSIYLITLFVVGTAIGSFLSVLIYRLHHREKGIFKGHSMCAECKTPLKAKDLVPLISYLNLRGKCRYCNKEISYTYPILELVSGFLYMVFFMKFPFVDEFLAFNGGLLIQYLVFSIYTFVLLFTFFFDLQYRHVADEVLLPAILIGLLATFAPWSPNIIDALIGLAIPVIFFSLQLLLSRGAWIGAGDLRVGAFMGIILGWKLVITAIIISYIIGSTFSIFIALKKHKFYGVKIPFAPYLVTGTFLAIFFGEKIISWYMNILNTHGSIL